MKTKMKRTMMRAIIIMIASIMVTVCGYSQSRKDSKKVKTPKQDIHTSVVFNDYESIIAHIESGTDINQVEPTGGSTPLISSVVFGRTEISRALIEAGADLEIKNNEGSTALFVAAMFCRTETLKLLLEKGADPETKNNYGSTPLETVTIPYETIEPVFDEISKGLGPLGLKLDYKRIREERPKIAEILSQYINKK